jgi:periplasmic protein TonB
MSVQAKRKAAEQIGTLSSCLIEGDSEQKARERKIKRRALVISVVLQSVALMALVLVPLLGRTEKLQYTLFTPIPQYYRSAPEPVVETRPNSQVHHAECIVCFDHPSPRPSMESTLRHTEVPNGEGIDIGGGNNNPNGIPGLGMFGNGSVPTRPEDSARDQKKRIVRGGDVQQAMLIRRVEPSYPRLMQTIRRPGRVELRAVISGDPGFYDSAMSAVRQWRYKPTLLNGQAVEVETIITVIYSLGQQ